MNAKIYDIDSKEYDVAKWSDLENVMKAGSEFGYEYSPKFNFPTSEHFAEMLRT